MTRKRMCTRTITLLFDTYIRTIRTFIIGIGTKTVAAVAWARLQAHFPDFARDLSAFPAALSLVGDGSLWRARILDQSDGLKIAEAQMQKMPDPTVGLFTASEVGGRERLTGIMLSIPIPGSQRNRHADRAVHADEMSRQEVASKKRQLDAVIGAGFARTQGAFEGWQIAEAGAAEMQDNARLMARAYALGPICNHWALVHFKSGKGQMLPCEAIFAESFRCQTSTTPTAAITFRR
jgi:hypothetical protein